MQLAGALCAICSQNVRFESDATWCARCSTVVHCECLAKAGLICPACHRTYDRPESHFVVSKECPECFRPNNPPQARCAFCGARTRWDTQAAYDGFLDHMKDTSRICAVRGVGELAGGMLCLLVLIAVLLVSQRPAVGLLSLLLLGFMILIPDGIFSLMRSRRIARFR